MDDSLKITYLDNIRKDPLSTSNINTHVNICIYSIYDTIEPYVLYLLHKLNNKLYWPHFTTTRNDNNEYIEYLKKMNIFEYEYKGFLVEQEEVYIYIKLENNFSYNKSYYKNINWFVSIYEILFPRKCWIYDIDSSVTELFINNPMSIYL